MHTSVEAYGEPSLAVGGFRLWVHGRQFPARNDEWDGNWLLVTALCEAEGARVCANGPILMTGDIEEFGKSCNAVLEGAASSALLDPLEPELRVELKATDRLGHIRTVVEITPDHLRQSHRLEYEIDQSFLPEIVRKCSSIVREYPIRGERGEGWHLTSGRSRPACGRLLNAGVLRTCVGGQMTASEFLEAYQGQTLEELIALESRYRVDSLVLACEAALLQKEAKAGRSTLSPQERVIVAIEALEREVNNGGYSQFFFNSSNQYAGEIVEALETIGCPKVAATTRRAMSALALEGQTSPSVIEAKLVAGGDGLDETLSQCDDEFYANADEDIERRLFEFIKANRSNISLR